MGLLSRNISSKTEETFNLSSEELTFLLQKMRSATYTGDEFEMFYTLWVKLTDQLKQE
jgi:hypothetical protein